jgi:hypothetical protein
MSECRVGKAALLGRVPTRHSQPAIDAHSLATRLVQPPTRGHAAQRAALPTLQKNSYVPATKYDVSRDMMLVAITLAARLSASRRPRWRAKRCSWPGIS